MKSPVNWPRCCTSAQHIPKQLKWWSSRWPVSFGMLSACLCVCKSAALKDLGAKEKSEFSHNGLINSGVSSPASHNLPSAPAKAFQLLHATSSALQQKQPWAYRIPGGLNEQALANMVYAFEIAELLDRELLQWIFNVAAFRMEQGGQINSSHFGFKPKVLLADFPLRKKDEMTRSDSTSISSTNLCLRNMLKPITDNLYEGAVHIAACRAHLEGTALDVFVQAGQGSAGQAPYPGRVECQ
eukprot:1155728-Pelagomonas_calceolata.AAC.12